ncbi:MAG: geranylgeranyl reductase family protein [Bacteroidia bacterium]|jgi:geranylgeranyl reductase family protein
MERVAEIIKTKVCIIGAGPAGSAASMGLSKHKVDHVLLDRATFPRDKICGDALSGKVVYVLNRIKPELVPELSTITDQFLPSWGISFVAPNGKKLDVPFKTTRNADDQAPGFIATRMDFDSFMFTHTVSKFCTTKTGSKVVDFEISKTGSKVVCSNGDVIEAELLIDCSGAHSKIAKSVGIEMELAHYSAGLRMYFENVADLHPEGYIELHFIKDVLPGYFWIFPMPNNRVNVGIGMLSKEVSRKKVNLKKEINNIIANHPEISKRFKNAKMIDDVKGWGLPMGSKKRQISSNRLMICGDAASIIDPFTGEGIGNAMISAKYAADVAAEALNENDFSSNRLGSYDQLVYKHLWPELNMSHKLQRMVKYPFLFNFVVNKGRRNKEFSALLTAMFENVDLRSKFRDPRFYMKLLFGGK